MRDAWQFLLGSIDQPVTLDYLCKINEYIARNEALEWGKLRTGSVMISETDYLLPVPSADTVATELERILGLCSTSTEKALEAFLWGAGGQFFWDGNKRTSMTLANKILIAAGTCFLTIADRHMVQFNALLVEYYSTGNREALKCFLYENAIQGIA